MTVMVSLAADEIAFVQAALVQALLDKGITLDDPEIDRCKDAKHLVDAIRVLDKASGRAKP